jgi:hypothetical protein
MGFPRFGVGVVFDRNARLIKARALALGEEEKERAAAAVKRWLSAALAEARHEDQYR